MRTDILESLVMKYQSEMAMASSNIKTYMLNSSGIGEHGDVVEAVEEQVKRFNEASEMVNTLSFLLDSMNEESDANTGH